MSEPQKIFGLPYKGSKNTIAERLIKALPPGKRFLDACCGGGAITQAAWESGKYSVIDAYDVNQTAIRLLDIIFNQEVLVLPTKLVTYEDFVASRGRWDTPNETLEDSVARCIASFGFNWKDYLWGKKNWGIKYKMHDAIAKPTFSERRSSLRDLMNEIIARGTVEDGKLILELGDVKNWAHIEQAANLRRLYRMHDRICQKKSEINCSVEFHQQSMFLADFDKYDVVYIDPPYKSAFGIGYRSSFDYEKFEKLTTYLLNKDVPVFISEYDAPPGYTEVASWEKSMTQSRQVNKSAVERLFFNGSVEKYRSLMGDKESS